MRNFYYIATFNLHSPTVRSYLEKALLLIHPSLMVDFKFRSKVFSTYNEAMNASEFDFAHRVEVLYDVDADPEIDELVVINPAYAINPEAAELSAAQVEFNTEAWDEACAAAIYCIDTEKPKDWLMKYEIYFADDAIEIVKNGEFERLVQADEDGDKFPSRLH